MRFNGKKLKRLRLEKGLRQSDIAAQTKNDDHPVDSRTLSHWENSPTANPRPQNVAAVARVLGITPEELYSFDDSEKVSASKIEHSKLTIAPLLEKLGFVCTLDEESVILRTNGRSSDILITIDELNTITNKTLEYIEFLLSKCKKE